MKASIKEAKSQADRLIARLRDLGVELKKTQALEGVAAVHNFADWNRYSAHLERSSSPDVVDRARAPLLHKLILLGPGEGKTSVLSLRFAEAIRENAGLPVWIDCNDGTSYMALPNFVREQVTRIEVPFDANGSIGEIAIPPDSARAVWISLINPDCYPSNQGRLEARSKAFCSLATTLRSTWPQKTVKRLSVIVIDDFHVLDQEYEGVFSQALPALAGDAAQLLIGTQYINLKHGIPASSLSFSVLTTKVQCELARFRGSSLLDGACRVDLSLPRENHNFDNDEALVEDITKLVVSALMWRHLAYEHLFGDSPRAWLIAHIMSEWKALSKRTDRTVPAIAS